MFLSLSSENQCRASGTLLKSIKLFPFTGFSDGDEVFDSALKHRFHRFAASVPFRRHGVDIDRISA
jgi:hypothetical protein